MENMEITILNLEKLNFKNNTTGEISQMVRITYGTRVPDEERFSGLAILECYQVSKYFDILKEYVAKKIEAGFKKVRLKNGFKLSLQSINGKKLEEL